MLENLSFLCVYLLTITLTGIMIHLNAFVNRDCGEHIYCTRPGIFVWAA
jgi:hypothetical protein